MENETKNLIVKDDISDEEIKNLIYTIRGKQVMLDSDVAMLYHYTTKNINKAVKRNIDRFPEDFCFQLTESEFQNLRFQFGTLNRKVNNGDVTRKYLPYVFTEQGISMLSGVLKNEIAVKRNIERFPENFCFQLTEKETENLRLQIATSSLEKEKKK